MSPSERSRRLADEVGEELSRLERTASELSEAARALGPRSSQPACMAAAGYLHAFYTGCEAVLSRILRALGEHPAGEGWHRTLILRAAAPVPGRRPPVVTGPTAEALDGLLRFRHFFRSAYGVELDAAKLGQHAARVPAALASFRVDVASFLAALDAAE